MRHLAVALLGGVFSITAVLASCSSPEAPPGPDAAAIDGVQACIDAYALGEELCQWHYSDTEKWCHDEFKNAGPTCRDLFSIEWACKLAALQAIPDAAACPEIWPCQDEFTRTDHCVWTYGCYLTLDCRDEYINPDGCNCRKFCSDTQVMYSTDCKPTGTTWTCDCYIDPNMGTWTPINLVGTCNQGGPFCDANVDLSCCNQFFMLPF